MSCELTEIEAASLQDCERRIQQGLKTFVEVGEALITIRDGRLYRITHGTFEAYCSEKWGMTRRYANLLIESSETVAVLGTIVPTLPSTESQVRPLAPLKDTPAIAVAAWEDAQKLAEAEGLPAPVARHVEAAAEPYRNALTEGKSRHFDYSSTASQESLVASVREKIVHVTNNSGENEWYTPTEYIEAARRVMGGIDLDPASSEVANRTVQAGRFITKEEDALSQDWKARSLWMNPPYSSDLIREFTKKFALHVASGDVAEGIVLVNNATETRWFAELVPVCSAIVFPTGRIRYLDSTGTPANSPLQGQAFLYAGSNPEGFIEEFSQFGWGAIIPSEEA